MFRDFRKNTSTKDATGRFEAPRELKFDLTESDRFVIRGSAEKIDQ